MQSLCLLTGESGASIPPRLPGGTRSIARLCRATRALACARVEPRLRWQHLRRRHERSIHHSVGGTTPLSCLRDASPPHSRLALLNDLACVADEPAALRRRSPLGVPPTSRTRAVARITSSFRIESLEGRDGRLGVAIYARVEHLLVSNRSRTGCAAAMPLRPRGWAPRGVSRLKVECSIACKTLCAHVVCEKIDNISESNRHA